MADAGVPFSFGGPALSLKMVLPSVIEYYPPDYDLYSFQEYSMGFSTRGCPRKCEFCIVPEKEGMIKVWQHPKEFHDTRFKTCAKNLQGLKFLLLFKGTQFDNIH